MDDSADWHPATRIIFRFAFVYLLLFIFPFPLGTLPFTDPLTTPYTKLWDAVVPWVGRHALRLSYNIDVVFNGSGDRTYNYVFVLCLFALAAIATVIWSFLDRKRTAYPRLYQWLRVVVRLYLGVVMISYGAFKVINSQFPHPFLDRLNQPIGDSSPMGLLWTFMGSSNAYTCFTGVAEMLGGILLFIPRTAALGALVSAGVLANVVMLNFSYDVPVKLYSLHYLALAIFLAAPEFRRLANVFLLNRPAGPAIIRPLFRREKLNRIALVARAGFLILVTGHVLYLSYQQWKSFQQHSPLYGIWEVDEFYSDGQAQPPLLTNESRWRSVIFDRPRLLVIRSMNDTRQRYRLELDEARKTLALTKPTDANWKAALTYEQPDAAHLAVTGNLDGHTIQAKLRRNDPPIFLRTRGFHWINESPLNR